MKILIIGGTGVISSDVTKELSKEHDVYVLNRGKKNVTIPSQVKVLKADVLKPIELIRALEV